ncbi:MAG: sugar transferase [Bacteroidales bacterium]|nr:sugar transferase [Bacteroidales bacterium]
MTNHYTDLDNLKTCYEKDYLSFPLRSAFAQERPQKLKSKASPMSYKAKRAMDIAVAVAGLICISPVFAVIYIAIRWSDGCNPIFSQERIGMHGREFYIYKFRSMRVDAESAGAPQLCNGDDDDRLTPIGRFLRAHHLDEIPQLWNVLKGDMSLVGYRPERKFFINQIRALAPEYDLLYSMRPGVFSYATLYNGYTDTMAKMLTRLRMDLDHLRDFSITTDLRIISLTLTSILTGKKF